MKGQISNFCTGPALDNLQFLVAEEDGVHDSCLSVLLANDEDGGVGGRGQVFVKVAVLQHDQVVLPQLELVHHNYLDRHRLC